MIKQHDCFPFAFRLNDIFSEALAERWATRENSGSLTVVYDIRYYDKSIIDQYGQSDHLLPEHGNFHFCENREEKFMESVSAGLREVLINKGYKSDIE